MALPARPSETQDWVFAQMHVPQPWAGALLIGLFAIGLAWAGFGAYRALFPKKSSTTITITQEPPPDPVAPIETVADAQLELGNVYLRDGNLTEAERAYRAVLTRADPTSRLHAGASVQLGIVLARRGDFNAAVTEIQKARAVFDALDDNAGIAVCLIAIARIQREQGDLAEAERSQVGALEIATTLGDRISQAVSLVNLGNYALDRDDHQKAEQRYRQALDAVRTLGDTESGAAAVNGLGRVALARGDLQLAKKKFDEALAIYTRLNARLEIGKVLGSLTVVAVEEDDLEIAREHAKGALAIFEEAGDANVALARQNLAEIERMIAEDAS